MKHLAGTKHIAMRATTVILLALVGASWSYGQRLVPSGINVQTSGSGLYALDEFDGKLIIGGQFYSIDGSPIRSIVSWDGSTVQAMPGAFDTSGPDHVRAMRHFQGELIVAGQSAGFGHIARWDGNAWMSMEGGLLSRVNALAVFDDGLIAGCQNGAVARWDGSTWSPMGEPMNGAVLALEEYNGQLYAGGAFTSSVSGQVFNRIARWSSMGWAPVGGGLNGQVNCLKGDALGLLIGGGFSYDADSTVQIPRCAVLQAGAFSPIPGVTEAGNVTGFFRHPGGRLLVGGARIDGFEFDLGWVRAMRLYNGNLYVAGIGHVFGAWRRTGALVKLVPGTQDAEIDVNGIAATVLPNPTSFHRPASGRSGFEAPKGEGTHTIYATSPWIRAHSDGQIHQALPWYYMGDAADELRDSGPLAAVMDDAYYERYHRVWKLDRALVQHHIANWSAPGYVIPEAIANWPGNGDASNGEPSRLAPFQDLDSDGFYEPQLGEYPVIKGTHAVYSILHLISLGDLAPTGAPAPPFDLHVMHYAFESDDSAVAHTVFVNYRFVNRSASVFDSIRFAQFSDFDIGCSNDDFAGCDSTRNLAFAYNWDEFDDTCFGALGYGAQPPAQGVRFLNLTMDSHRDFHRESSQPITTEDLLYGLEMGQPYMNLGYPTHFQYPGGAWTDTQMFPVDRRTISATGPYTLGPNDTLCIDLAFIYARASSGGAYASVGALKLRSDSVQAFYDAQGIACSQYPVMTGVREQVRSAALRLFPNPATQSVTLQTDGPLGEVLVFDMQGRVVHRDRTAQTRLAIDIAPWAPGAYAVRVGQAIVRLMKE